MHSNRIFPKIISFTPLLLLLIYPSICRYDFLKSTMWYYDFLSMNGNLLCFIFLMIAGILLGLRRKNDLTLCSLLAIVFLFSVAEVSTNYPMIWRDVFYHGSAVKAITNDGHVGDTWIKYPQTQPGFFLLWSIVTLITGLGIFESNLLLLLPVAVTLLIMLLILIYRKMSIAWKGATLLAFLLMNFNMNEFMFLHFNTRLLSLIYTLLFLFLFLSEQDKRENIIAILVTYIALVISHILNSLVPIVFFVIYLLPKWRRVDSRTSLFLSCTIVYIAWNLYVGYLRLTEGLTTFLNYYYINLSLDIASGWLPWEAKPKPFFGLLLGTYYKVLLVVLVLISLYSAMKLRRQTRVKVLSFYLLSIFVVYGFSFFSILSWISIHRGVIFALVPLACLPMILFTSTTKDYLKNWKRKMLTAAVMIMIFPHFVLVHELPLTGLGNPRSIAQASSFVSNYRNGQPIVCLDDDFHIYYSFFEPFYKGYDNLELRGLNSISDVTAFLTTRPRGTLKILDYRTIIHWGAILGHNNSYDEASREWYSEVYRQLNERHNIVYSAGFDTIYT